MARRLRERAGKRVLNLGELFWCIGCDDGDDAAAWNRLADLIDPGELKTTCIAEVKIEGEKLEEVVNRAIAEYTGIDRDALLRLARYMDKDVAETEAHFSNVVSTKSVSDYARRIREACGEGER